MLGKINFSVRYVCRLAILVHYIVNCCFSPYVDFFLAILIRFLPENLFSPEFDHLSWSLPMCNKNWGSFKMDGKIQHCTIFFSPIYFKITIFQIIKYFKITNKMARKEAVFESFELLLYFHFMVIDFLLLYF